MNDVIKLMDLIEGCKKGDKKSQSIFFEKYYDLTKKTISYYYKDKDGINDIIQDVFIKVFNKIHLYDNEGSFDGWFKKVVKNHIFDILRQKKKMITVEYVDSIDSDIIDLEYENNIDEKLNDIKKLSETLSKSYGIVFNMYFIEQLSHKEIADKLGISEGTSKSNLHKAKKNIIDKLKEKKYDR